MKLWQKVAVAPLVAMVFLVTLAAVSYGVLSMQSRTLEQLYKERFSAWRHAAQAAQGVGEVHSNVYRLFTWIQNLKPEEIERTTAEQRRKLDAVGATLDAMARLQLEDEDRRMVGDVAVRLAKYRDSMLKAIDLSTVDVSIGAMQMQSADTSFQEMVRVFTQLVARQESHAERAYARAEAAYRNAVLALVVLAVMALVICGAVSVAMSRGIVRPLRRAIGHAGRIAGGDLTAEIRTRSADETGDLLRALAGMNHGLVTIVGQVRAGTETISAASAQISAGSQDLSQRTEEQASALEQTAASMEELTSTVRQNADSAREAHVLAAEASRTAVQGGQVMGNVVDTMGRIETSARRITDITGVIDGIAFQTNILALNAAVEAARAGDQGRGFAVVAAEVRTLAQRSAAAAREIKSLIEESTGNVAAGSKLVAQAGHTMQDVVAGIERVSTIVGEISSATAEQTRGIEQVNQAITDMERVTQQNASLVEEASAAAQAMREQAGELLKAVSVFRVAGRAPVDGAGTGAPRGLLQARPSAGGPRLPLASAAT
jgi:methyl-accepting chemotaxis protein